MCNEKTCSHKADEMCSCYDLDAFRKEDAEEMLKIFCHVRCNLADAEWELDYFDLDVPEQRRLCIVGTCSVCGDRLCTGIRIEDSLAGDDLLATLYRYLYQLHGAGARRLSYSAFRERFIRVFHEADQADVRAWLDRPENKSVQSMCRRSKSDVVKKVYTIIHTSVDADRSSFPDPSAEGSFLSLSAAQERMSELVAEEKDSRDFHCADEGYREEYGDDYWEAYEDGYEAANFTRFDILTSELHENE